MNERLEVEVDPDICMGMGYCARTAPSVFELDSSGVVRLVGDDEVGPVEVLEEQRPAVVAAASLCPSGSIILRD